MFHTEVDQKFGSKFIVRNIHEQATMLVICLYRISANNVNTLFKTAVDTLGSMIALARSGRTSE